MHSKTSNVITTVRVSDSTTILEIKTELNRQKKGPYVERQSLRAEAKGKSLADSETIKSLGLKGNKLYYKDLGPQIGWKTVFLVEYGGPLIVYLWVYSRPWLFYGNAQSEMHQVVQ